MQLERICQTFRHHITPLDYVYNKPYAWTNQTASICRLPTWICDACACWYVFTVCAYMGKEPASTSRLLTQFVLCECKIVWITCACTGETPAVINQHHLSCSCVWVYAWHAYTLIMSLRASTCYELRPRLWHMCGVCMQKQALWGHADSVTRPWNVIWILAQHSLLLVHAIFIFSMLANPECRP